MHIINYMRIIYPIYYIINIKYKNQKTNQTEFIFREQSCFPGATQIHPKAADNREDNHHGSDFHGKIFVQRVDGYS